MNGCAWVCGLILGNAVHASFQHLPSLPAGDCWRQQPFPFTNRRWREGVSQQGSDDPSGSDATSQSVSGRQDATQQKTLAHVNAGAALHDLSHCLCSLPPESWREIVSCSTGFSAPIRGCTSTSRVQFYPRGCSTIPATVLTPATSSACLSRQPASRFNKPNSSINVELNIWLLGLNRYAVFGKTNFKTIDSGDVAGIL